MYVWVLQKQIISQNQTCQIFVERKAFEDKEKRKQGEAERAFRKQRTSGTCERAAGKSAGWEETQTAIEIRRNTQPIL